MKTVLVTGATGFVGKNLCAQLELEDEVEIIKFTRSNSTEDLKHSVKKADFIFHLAGVNRPKDDSEFAAGNTELTQQVLAAIEESDKNIPLLLTSSIQADLDNAYGKSKKAAEHAVLEWSKSSSVPVYIYRLPNVFGKWSKPDYNSVVATFAHNIANDKPIQINDPAKVLTLVYVDDVVRAFVKALHGELPSSSDCYYTVEQSYEITLQQLADSLKYLHQIRKTSTVPELDDFKRALYATYISYLPIEMFDYALEKKEDNRGWLAEVIKSNSFGQIFVSKTKPGISRGNHWHHTKIEKFLVIDGKAEIKFRDYGTDEIITYAVTGEEMRVVDIPVGYIHSITNTGMTDLLTLFWADEVFDPQYPDTHYAEVEQ